MMEAPYCQGGIWRRGRCKKKGEISLPPFYPLFAVRRKINGCKLLARWRRRGWIFLDGAA